MLPVGPRVFDIRDFRGGQIPPSFERGFAAERSLPAEDRPNLLQELLQPNFPPAGCLFLLPFGELGPELVDIDDRDLSLNVVRLHLAELVAAIGSLPAATSGRPSARASPGFPVELGGLLDLSLVVPLLFPARLSVWRAWNGPGIGD